MKSENMLTRRSAVLGTAAATALMLLPTKRAWPATSNVRPDAASPAGATMVDAYAAAVKAMQDPAINYPPQPQSWTFQAYMHAVPRNPFDPANSGGIRHGTVDIKTRIDQIYGQPAANTPQAAWKNAALECWATCEHSSPYFTTWHRWYLYYFERICRKMSNRPDFVLPYWNYASDTGSSLQLPGPFRDLPQPPAPQNVLFFDDRGLGFADGQATGPQNVAMNEGGFMPFSIAQYDPALAAKVMFPSDDQNNASFNPGDPAYLALGFTGRLECVPHDMVHSYVGGWMQNVPSAAGDPIFYLHHCQIDRLYASWEAQPGSSYNFGSSANQPDENTWKNLRMGSYVNENGQLVKEKLGGAINISALNYSYDKLAPAAAPELTAALESVRPATRLRVAAMEAPNFAVQSGGTTVTLAPAAAVTAVPETPAANNAPAGQTLVLKGIRLVRRPRAPLSVFINLPKGTAPRLNDAFYVGTLNLFNFDLGTGVTMEHADDAMPPGHKMPGPDARFDVTEVLQRQRAKGQWDGGAITVTISTIGIDSAAAAITYLTIDGVALVP
jgi:tyrosinase